MFATKLLQGIMLTVLRRAMTARAPANYVNFLVLGCDSNLHNLFAAVYINEKSRFYSASLAILNILTIATIAIRTNAQV